MYFYTLEYDAFWMPLRIKGVQIGRERFSISDASGGAFVEKALELVLDEIDSRYGLDVTAESENGERHSFHISPDDMKYFRYPYKFAY